MEFSCRICGTDNDVPLIHREFAFCRACGSNARLRGVVRAIFAALELDASQPLSHLPSRKTVSAIGCSDHPCYARELEALFSYTNTFLHQEPFLDLCDPASVARYANLDLVICSDVLEHTGDPPPTTIRRLVGMVRPGGAVILSLPTYLMPATVEWYPRARSLQVVARGPNDHVVVWENARGVVNVDTRPAFHGGPGEVLEMRLCAHEDILRIAADAGAAIETVPFAPEVGYEWPIIPEDPAAAAPMDGRIFILRRNP